MEYMSELIHSFQHKIITFFVIYEYEMRVGYSNWQKMHSKTKFHGFSWNQLSYVHKINWWTQDSFSCPLCNNKPGIGIIIPQKKSIRMFFPCIKHNLKISGLKV